MHMGSGDDEKTLAAEEMGGLFDSLLRKVGLKERGYTDEQLDLAGERAIRKLSLQMRNPWTPKHQKLAVTGVQAAFQSFVPQADSPAEVASKWVAQYMRRQGILIDRG